MPSPCLTEDDVFRSGRDGRTPMAEWLTPPGTSPFRALGACGPAECARAPDHASRYEAQAFRFTAGLIRVLRFDRDPPPLHVVTTETQLYVARGRGHVGLAGRRVAIAAGDLVNLPSGVFEGAAGDDTVELILFTLRATVARPRAALVDGVEGDDLSAQTYAFDGGTLQRVTLAAGGSIPPGPRADTLIYVLQGRLRADIGAVATVATAGDAISQPAGAPCLWEVLEPATLLTMTAA